MKNLVSLFLSASLVIASSTSPAALAGDKGGCKDFSGTYRIDKDCEMNTYQSQAVFWPNSGKDGQESLTHKEVTLDQKGCESLTIQYERYSDWGTAEITYDKRDLDSRINEFVSFKPTSLSFGTSLADLGLLTKYHYAWTLEMNASGELLVSHTSKHHTIINLFDPIVINHRCAMTKIK